MSTVTLESPHVALESGTTGPLRLPTLSRRLIVDERRSVAAYQLVPSARSAAGDHAFVPDTGDDAAQEPTASLVKPTFVRCSCTELGEAQLRRLDPRSIVLEITDTLEADGGSLDAAVLQAACRKGFKLAFDARLLRKDYAAFVPFASYVILEMGALELDRATGMARSIQSNTKASVLASQVRTTAQYEQLAGAGVKLFEGLWFTEPPARPDPAAKLSYASLIKLLNLVVREAEVVEIEDLLKHEPGLAFQLLRHINSAGFGSNIEITSFRHAVMTIGMRRLFRWTALLTAHTSVGSVAPAVGTLAIVRGRLMELLSLDKMQPAHTDLAFVTGMFSMLDTLLGVPLKDAMALVCLPEPVTDAVLHGEGVFARYLAIAKACESADEVALRILSERHRMPHEYILAKHTEALAWAEQLGQ